MSRYITIKELTNVFDESDFPKDENGNNDHSRIDESIDFSQNIVDNFLRSAGLDTSIDYQSGIDEIRGVVMDITWYRLQDHPSSTVKERYDQAMEWLEKLLKGVVKLSPKPVDTNNDLKTKSSPSLSDYLG